MGRPIYFHEIFAMTNRPLVPRKRMYHAHDRKIILAKNPDESGEHVLMKAFLWALYLPDYPTLTVEIRIGDRYKPDVVALNEGGKPLFWGEAGQVSMEKVSWQNAIAIPTLQLPNGIRGLTR
jgi:hypothetical protein